MQLNLFFKSLLQPGFSRKGPHERQSRDGLPQQARQLADLLLTALSSSEYSGGKAAHHEGHKGRQHQCGQG